MKLKFSRLTSIVFALSWLVASLYAAPLRAADDEGQDPPTRVARLSAMDGSVSLQPGGTGEWGNAAMNRPVTIGDKLWVDAGARAELQAGQASIHVGDMTALSFLNLNEGAIQMRLAEGKVNFRVRELRQGDVYEVDTPNAAFTVRQAGAFRIDVPENGDSTSITVIRGTGEVVAGGQTYTLNAGERAEISGTEQNIRYESGVATGPDALDKWAQERDLREENSTSARYVSREVVGYSDLDDYGTWKEEPSYGNVWYPSSTPVGWAPYSNGYWNWVSPWGWTWVDYSPWGFAPYHYGRWIYGGGGWGWCPGPIYGPAVYGPAYVGFVGGFGIGFGFGWGFGGGIGWFPLGWGEPYHPWYHCGHGYYRNVNIYNTTIRNTTIINNQNSHYNYMYAKNPNAVTATSHSNFVAGQAIHRNNMPVNEASLRGAHVMTNAGLNPTHASNFGASTMHGRVATPSASVQSRPVITRATPSVSASHLPTRPINTAALTPGRPSNSTMGSRFPSSAGVNTNRPPSAMSQGTHAPVMGDSQATPRTWHAQGNTTDSGRAPSGFGNRSNVPPQTSRNAASDRPPWARSSMGGGSNGTNRAPTAYRPPAANSPNRPPSSWNTGRTSNAPVYSNRGSNPGYNRAPRSIPQYSSPRGGGGYSAPRSIPQYSSPRGGGGYSAPRSMPQYSAPRGGGYSAPRSGGSSAPHYSAPRSSGGGGSPHSGGAGSSHGGGGGSPHTSGGGGGGSHHH